MAGRSDWHKDWLDDFLRVNFDTRVYSDGGGRVDVSVENVLDMTGATTVTYDVDIAINSIGGPLVLLENRDGFLPLEKTAGRAPRGGASCCAPAPSPPFMPAGAARWQKSRRRR